METTNTPTPEQLGNDQESKTFFKDLVLKSLEDADRKYNHLDEYLRVRSGVIAYYQKGEYKKAWLDLANYLGTKLSHLNEAENLENPSILRILAEQINPVVTKGDILNIVNKLKKN